MANMTKDELISLMDDIMENISDHLTIDNEELVKLAKKDDRYGYLKMVEVTYFDEQFEQRIALLKSMIKDNNVEKIRSYTAALYRTWMDARKILHAN